MGVFREISDISEFDDNGPATWFAFNPNTMEGFGSDAFTWEQAVSEVCDAIGGDVNEYPMPMRWTGDGVEVMETMVEARVAYRCSLPTLTRQV